MHRVLFSILVLTSLAFSKPALTQTRTIDSLKKTVRNSVDQAKKQQAILALCDQGYNLHPDTLMHYAAIARNTALRLNNLHDEVEAMYYESSALTVKGLIDSSLEMANQCLAVLSGKVNDPVLQANIFNQKGRCYMRKNQYKEAIDMGYHVIENAEKSGNTLLQIKGKTLIGWAYLEMGQIKEALSWHLKAFQTTSDTLLLEKYAILFANLAINYNDLGKTDSAIYFINKAISYARKYDNLFALSNSLAIQAQIFVRSGQGNLAERPLKEVVEIRKLIGDPFYIVSDMSQLCLYYAHYGHPDKGIALCNEGIALAKQYKMDTKLFFLYSTLAENYKVLGDTTRYASILEKIISLKDSVYQANSAEALAEMQTNYDLQKKENIIIQQKFDIVSKDYLLYGSLILGLFSVIIFSLLFKNYKRRKKMELLVMRQEEKRMSFLAVRGAEENERKRIAADLHDNMGAYASAIIANVDEMVLHRNEMNENLLQHLKTNAGEVMSNLRDTIWALNKERISLTGISDRVKNYVQKISPTYPDIKVEIEENIHEDILFSPVQALNIFRILQEALTNALKHSHCNYIKICIACDETMNISVADNGSGIDENYLDLGNGIRNMQARAKESGFTLTIKNANRGTEVLLIPG